MKHYIKSFLLFALVCVGLVSCNEQETSDNVTYPAQPTLQTWKSSGYNKSGSVFYVVNMAGLDNDTICHVFERPADGSLRIFAMDGSSEYDAGGAMYTNLFSSSELEGYPLEVATALRGNGQVALVRLSALIDDQHISWLTFTAAAQKGFPIDETYWESLDPEAPVQAILLFLPENKFMSSIGDALFAGTYEWNEVQGQGVLHMTDADEDFNPLPDASVKDQSIYLNQLNQFVMSVDGTEHILKLSVY